MKVQTATTNTLHLTWAIPGLGATILQSLVWRFKVQVIKTNDVYFRFILLK